MNSIQSLNRDLKKKINKSMKKLKKQLVDYEKYRDNYEYMKFSPLVQSLIQENNELKMINATLKEKLKKYKKTPLRKGLYDNVTVKTEPGSIIDLTDENDPCPNIVYELIEDSEESEEEEAEEEEAEEEEAEELEEEEAEELEEEEEEEAEELEEEEEEEEEEAEEEEEPEEEEELEEEEEEEAEEEEELEEEEAEEEEELEEEEAEEEEAEEEEAEEEEAEEEAAEEEEAEEAEEEEELEEEEAEEVYEVIIKNKKYYTTNETNGVIYSITQDGDIGDEIGKYDNGKHVFNK